MVLSPLDIHNKDFAVKMRGYDQDEVNEFLTQVIKDYEMVLKERKALELELKASQEKVAYFNELKDALNQSIIVAQDAADKVKENSEKEAGIITKEAQQSAEDMLSEATDKSNRIIVEASEKAKQITIETDDLKKQTRIFRQRLQVMLDTQVELVKSPEWDEMLKPADEENAYKALQEVLPKLDKDSVDEVESETSDTFVVFNDPKKDAETSKMAEEEPSVQADSEENRETQPVE